MDCVRHKEEGKAVVPADFPLEFFQKGWPGYFLVTSREKAIGSD